MKNLLVICFLALGLFACDTNETAANEGVPAAVVSAFEAAYPGATDVEWDAEGDGYEVEFELNGEDMEVEYDKNGKVIEFDD